MNESVCEKPTIVDTDKTSFSPIEIGAEEDKQQSGAALNAAENADETIRRSLSSYEIGAKLKHLRLRKKIALIDLGRHTGLSASMLSQLENGKLIPTLPTLTRIAMFFDVGLEFFFRERKAKRAFSFVRAEERKISRQLPQSPVPGYGFEALNYGAPDRSLAAYLTEFSEAENEQIHEHTHEGSEFLHVLSGDLSFFYQSEEHILHTGDSVYFDASEPHSYRSRSDVPAKAILVTAPPRP
ncbi:MAG TPA: XRE family transcriptional regulator [Chthoniobacterales bacterium]|nr:XRE family transcriptional regulator [Chthoniobacterales bacterium]